MIVFRTLYVKRKYRAIVLRPERLCHPGERYCELPEATSAASGGSLLPPCVPRPEKFQPKRPANRGAFGVVAIRPLDTPQHRINTLIAAVPVHRGQISEMNAERRRR
jgi:hypothetical protein